jgi:hypothetical protein
MRTSFSISWEKFICYLPSNSSISFKKINGLKGLKHTILHICFFLQSNLKLWRSFTGYLWILRASPHIFLGAIMVPHLINVQLCPQQCLFFHGPPSLESIFFCISQRISSFHYVEYISVKLLGIWNLSSRSFYILLCVFFEMTHCKNFINLFII